MEEAAKLRKALDAVALEYAQGNCSIDLLMKAHEAFKAKTNFDDDMDYQIVVAKSCYDYLNGVERNAEIEKAVLPGTTKVVDGIMYVYSPTAPGSQQPYDWHVVKKVARGKTLDDSQISKKQSYVNALFPTDLSSVKVVRNAGGSTGAQIVEDVKGNRFIMKRGTNTNNGHVQSEYLTNQLYDIMGIRVPDYELYDDNGTAVILSRFIPNCHQPTAKDYKALAQGFIADCVLANWDVYQNDNTLIDYAGRVVRVDNGGALDYRAHGSKKRFDDDILDTFKSMIQYNQSVYSNLSASDVAKQIRDIQARKQDIVDYLNQSGSPLASVIEKRIDNLKEVLKYLKTQTAIKDTPILPRKLKSKKEMYRDFDDAELKALWDNARGSDGNSKLLNTGKNGWALLGEICKLRGFDARPEVVDETEYWKRVAANPGRQFFRGLDNNWISADAAVKSLLFDDDCFYGTQAAYGEGIYAHRNDKNGVANKSDKTNYKQEGAWKHARDYAHSGGAIVKGVIQADANIVAFDALQKELESFVPTKDPFKVKKIQGEIKALDKAINNIQDQIDNFDNNMKSQVFSQMKYDETAAASMMTDIEAVDWGAVNAFGERQIPSFKDFVEGKMVDWVKAQGGKATVRKGVVTFELPNSTEKCSINAYQYDGPFSILRKNPFSPAYSGAVSKFVNWMETEHISRAVDAFKAERDKSGDKISTLQKQRSDKVAERHAKEDELRDATTADDSTIMNSVYKNRGYRQVLGVFAALRGYDAIECRNGNSRDNSFYVILNRSKLTVSNEVDYV